MSFFLAQIFIAAVLCGTLGQDVALIYLIVLTIIYSYFSLLKTVSRRLADYDGNPVNL